MPDDLRSLAQFGAFFAVGPLDGRDGWRPLRGLLDGETLDERVARVRAALSASAGGEVELRVAASTMSLGLFARLVSPALGAAALQLRLPRPTLDSIWWRAVDSGPWLLALTGPRTQVSPAGVLTEVLEPVAEYIGRRYGLSRLILRGNAASAVFGAVNVIRSVRIDLLPTARDLAAALLSGPLSGTGQLHRQRFVRFSCCLYYRVPGGGYCGDCVLVRRR